MKIIQSRSFEKRIKKLNQAWKKVLDEQIKLILENPHTGDQKKATLANYVDKFKIKTIQYHLATGSTKSNLS